MASRPVIDEHRVSQNGGAGSRIRAAVLACVVVATGGAGVHGQNRADATIAGRIIDESSGEGVSGASVVLEASRYGLTAAGDPIVEPLPAAALQARGLGGSARSLTDAAGQFRFEGLSAADYSIVVTHRGYSPSEFGGHGIASVTGKLLHLQAGEQRDGVRIALVKLATIAGRVTDDLDDPVTKVDVHALRRELIGGAPRFSDAGVVRTDDRGDYRFSSLKPGEYIVAVPSTAIAMPESVTQRAAEPGANVLKKLAESGGLVPGPDAESSLGFRIAYRGPRGDVSVQPPGRLPHPNVYPSTFSPSAVSMQEAVVLSLTGGASLTADVRVSQMPSFTVSGSLRLPDGVGPHVSIRLLPDWSASLASDRGFETAMTTTGDDGTFTFAGVPAGTYSARALIDKSGWAPTPGSLASLPTLTVIAPRTLAAPMGALEDPVWSAAVRVDVDGRDIDGVALVPQAGGRFAGHIALNSQTSPGRLFEQIGLLLSDIDTGHRDGLARRAVIDAQGAFTMPAYPPARYGLEFALPGQWRVESVTAAGQDLYCGSVDLRSGDVTDAIITLTTKETTMVGTLQAPVGRQVPTEGSMVAAFPANVDGWIAAGMNGHCLKKGDASEGSFVLHNLTPGDYLVLAAGATAFDFRDPVQIRAAAARATRVMVRSGLNRLAALVRADR